MEYIIIETLFERDMNGTKKLIEGAFRNEAVEFLQDAQWCFTEKIDGTNIRVCWDGHTVSFAGRTDRASIPPTLLARLEEMFGGNENEQLFEQFFGEKEVVLFGEGYGPKIQNGGLYRADVSFILFDVYIGGLWLTRDACENIATAFDLDVVPIVQRGTLQQAIDLVKSNPKSTMGTAAMEGVVGRPAVELNDRRGNRVIVKIKAKDF